MAGTLSQTAGPEQLPAVGWIDLHNHVLPDLDDGPVNWEESLALCREMVRQGITHTAATPHLFGPYNQPSRVATITQRLRELVQRIEEACIALTVYQGADMQVGDPLTKALAENGVLPVGLNGSYLLIDPTISAPHGLPDLSGTGYRGVLANPECNRDIQQQGPNLLVDWADQDGILQVAAGSLLGDAGAAAKRLAWRILESELPAIVASDAHDMGHRPPRMAEAIKAITARLDWDATVRVCRDTPWSLIHDAEPAYLHAPARKVIPSPEAGVNGITCN